MTQPVQQPPTVGDLALDDLATQLSEASRKLAIVRAQYAQLAAFVESKSDVLGLTRTDADGQPVPQASASDVPADSEQQPINGAKRVSANTGT